MSENEAIEKIHLLEHCLTKNTSQWISGTDGIMVLLGILIPPRKMFNIQLDIFDLTTIIPTIVVFFVVF